MRERGIAPHPRRPSICFNGAMIVLRVVLLALGLALTARAAPPDPFATLRAAYAAKDATAAAAAYADNAELVFRYDGTPEERHAGRAAIEASFAAFFAQFPDEALDLNFRVAAKDGAKATGIYRLRIGANAVSFGTFEIAFAPDGTFLRDTSGSADIAAFEALPGPVLLDADEDTLDPAFYGRLAGRYALPDGCTLVVTRSVVRLFARNTCTLAWQGLTRVTGLEWTGGATVLAKTPTATLRFAAPGEGDSATLTVETATGTHTATRADAYRREAVTFSAADGTILAGTLHLPLNATDRRPATVLLHGSGPQDRDGYASIIAVMADALAAAGRVVLTYDKRGIRGSGGDWSRAGFDVLGADAKSGMDFLATRAEVDPARIGLAGSSQAGWVAAAAIAGGAAPADVFLLGAAGSALTVREQNLYNTETLMRCAGIADDDIALALAQQTAFFDFLADPAKAAALDDLTRQARDRPALTDWLFPDSASTDRSAGAWYVVLDPAFDPLPVWRAFGGNALFVFAEHDDSTPTALAMKRLADLRPHTTLLPASQHLGLLTDNICRANLENLSAFSPAFFQALDWFAP